MRWRETYGRDIGVAVNISPVQAADRFGHIEEVLNDLQQRGLNVSLLDLEVTENLLLDNEPETLAALERLRARGCRMFLDDFGTGYSSLSYLKRYPFDIIKIDRSFIIDMLDDPQARELVDAIIAMARGLEMDVVAEGVENAEQLEYLKTHRCRYAQGYYLAHPMPTEEVDAWLAEHLSR